VWHSNDSFGQNATFIDLRDARDGADGERGAVEAALEFVEYFALLKEMPAARVPAAVATAVERVDLGDQAKAKLRTLSGGMLRRVGIAQAIVNEPELLLLDEPTAGLDPEQRVHFRALLRDLGQRATVVVSTHLVEDVGAACSEVALMEVACLGCAGVVYGMTARQASWGGPLWWPAAVSVAGVPALTAIGFAAGAWFPGRFVTPLVTVAVFFGFGISTQAASGDHSYWQISPLTAGAFDIGAAPGVGTFYHYLPDLSIAQVMFTIGLTATILGALGLSDAFGAGSLTCSGGRPAGSSGRRLLWHPPTLTTPWIWSARPPHDVGGALCAALVFAVGMVAITVRGARESAGD
jgi:hypothetical protein